MIQLFYIKDCQVKVVLTDETEYCFSQTLDELTECLNPSLFFRANRQYLISREAIKDIDLWFNSRLSINLYYSGIKEKILVSKARVAEFKEWFSKRKRWFRDIAFLEQIAKQSVSCRETIGFNAWNKEFQAAKHFVSSLWNCSFPPWNQKYPLLKLLFTYQLMFICRHVHFKRW